jgi:hypothetical protein
MNKPFDFIFEKVEPQEFARLFEEEADQTKAFVLSFSPNAEYIEAVLEVYKDNDLTILVTDYLSRVEEQAVNVAFVSRLEEHVHNVKKISEKVYSKDLRKNMTLKKGKEYKEVLSKEEIDMLLV